MDIFLKYKGRGSSIIIKVDRNVNKDESAYEITKEGSYVPEVVANWILAAYADHVMLPPQPKPVEEVVEVEERKLSRFKCIATIIGRQLEHVSVAGSKRRLN